MIKSSKSQSALEFLTTYGWAFLVILIMIAALAYFGILTPSKVLPNRCIIGPEFSCIDYQISATAGTFRLRLKNSLGEPIDVTSISFSTESSASYSGCTPSGFSIPYNAWKSGNVSDLIWTGCTGGGLIAGEKGKVLISIKYNTASGGASYTREAKGEVYSVVQ